MAVLLDCIKNVHVLLLIDSCLKLKPQYRSSEPLEKIIYACLTKQLIHRPNYENLILLLNPIYEDLFLDNKKLCDFVAQELDVIKDR